MARNRDKIRSKEKLERVRRMEKRANKLTTQYSENKMWKMKRTEETSIKSKRRKKYEKTK